MRSKKKWNNLEDIEALATSGRRTEGRVGVVETSFLLYLNDTVGIKLSSMKTSKHQLLNERHDSMLSTSKRKRFSAPGFRVSWDTSCLFASLWSLLAATNSWKRNLESDHRSSVDLGLYSWRAYGPFKVQEESPCLFAEIVNMWMELESRKVWLTSDCVFLLVNVILTIWNSPFCQVLSLR